MYVKYVESREYEWVADTLKKCERALGKPLRVAKDGDYANNTAAFVETATSDVYMVEHTLDDEGFAVYAAKHEKEHIDNGVKGLNIEHELESHQYRALLSLSIAKFQQLISVLIRV